MFDFGGGGVYVIIIEITVLGIELDSSLSLSVVCVLTNVYFHLFSQLFVRHPQTTTLNCRIVFSWGWFSSPPGHCYKPPSIVIQAPCLPDIIP